MIIDTMNPRELTTEIGADYLNIQRSLERLARDYDRERRRGKVDKQDPYPRAYDIKTKKKNTWIIVMDKAYSEETYKGVGSIGIACLVYYYTPIGLRVFKIMLPQGLSVFNSHLFKRYNERLDLGLSSPLEIVKHFFIHNPGHVNKILPKGGREFTVGICKEGLLLGELQEGRLWLVYKTFITRDLMGPEQGDIEGGLINSLREDIEKELNSPEFNREAYTYKADIYKGIK